MGSSVPRSYIAPMWKALVSLHRPLACALLLAGTSAWAQLPAVRLAVSELAPWMTRQGGHMGGAYPEIVRELARRLATPLETVDCPLKRCLKRLEVGQADLAIGLRQPPERRAYLHYLASPYRRSSSDRVFLLRRGDTRRLASYEDLRGLRIGVTDGSEYFPRFKADRSLNKDVGPNSESSLRKLMLQRVATVILPDDQALALVAQLGLRERVEFAPLRVPEPTPRAIAVSRRSALMTRLPALEQAMQSMREDGTLAAIYERHYYRVYDVTPQRIRID